MGYFDFVSPELAPDDVADDEASNYAYQQADARRSLVKNEDSTVKLEQGAIRKIHSILDAVTHSGTDFEDNDSSDPQIHQVKNALDKGMLKPHQVVADVEQLLKRKWKYPGLTEALADGLNDLKLSQQQRQAQANTSQALGPAPQTPPEVFAGQSNETFEQARKLRDDIANMGVLGTQAKASQAKTLEAQAASLKQRADEAKQAQAAQERPEVPNADLHSSIDSNIKAAGKDPAQFRQALIAGARTLEEKTGVTTSNLKDPVPFSRALLTGLQIFDPQGIILGQLQQDLQSSAPQPQGQDQSATATTPEETKAQRDYDNLAVQRRQLYQQLGQTPELQNWFGVLSFIFLAVITRSPAVAASILGISQRQGNLKAQLDMIEQDMHDQAAKLKHAQHEGDIQRKTAAELALRKKDKADEYRKELMKMYLQHHMILLREAQRHPAGGDAYKRLDKDFARYASMESAAHGEMDRAQRVLSNDFADEKLKEQAQKDFIKAQKDYTFWKTKRAELNAVIEQMGAGSEEPEGDQQ